MCLFETFLPVESKPNPNPSPRAFFASKKGPTPTPNPYPHVRALLRLGPVSLRGRKCVSVCACFSPESNAGSVEEKKERRKSYKGKSHAFHSLSLSQHQCTARRLHRTRGRQPRRPVGRARGEEPHPVQPVQREQQSGRLDGAINEAGGEDVDGAAVGQFGRES